MTSTVGRQRLQPAHQHYLYLLVGLQVLLAVVVVLGTLVGLRDMREEVLTSHLRQASLQVRSFEDHVSQNLYLVSLMLTSLPELIGDPNLTKIQRHGNLLESIQRQMPVLRSVSIADRQGRILVSSVQANVGTQVEFSDFLPITSSPHEGLMRFGVVREGRDFHDSRKTTAATPVDARANYFLPAIQHLPGPTGFIAIAAINPDYIVNHMVGHIDAALGHVALFDYQGMTALTTWEGHRAGSEIEDKQILELVRSTEIGERLSDQAHGKEVLTAYRALRNYPFFVLTHIDREAALNLWREDVVVRLTVVALALLSTLFMTGLLTFRLHAFFVREARLQEAQRAVFKDMTQQRDSEQTIRQLSMAVEQSPSSIVITGTDASILYVNPRFTAVTGYQPEEVIGKNPRIMQSKRTPSPTYDAMWARLTGGYPWEGEFINRRKDGSIYYEHATVAPIKDANGDIINYVAIKYDITERKQLEQELLQAKELAEAANVAKSRFLANMSHEIRTPMNGILGMAQLLLNPGLSQTERQDYTRTILNSGQSLLTLLNDILDYSKIEAGKLELEHVIFEPGPVLQELQALFAETARSKGLQLQTAWHGGAHTYLLDAYRLRQMLSNLIGNAIKFTAQGTVLIEATEIKRNNHIAELEFSVTDTGIGISADQQALLFKPFSQADSSTTRQFGGTGLGLSIVKHLACLMGGNVGVNSELGKGSRFWFRIHAKFCAHYQHHEAQTHMTALPNVQTGLHGTLLVVEDDATNQKVICTMLHTLGIATEVANNGQEAINRITQGECFDLILMDVQMPVLDGLTATAQIRQRERSQGEPRRTIIALTADAFAEDRTRCINVGMDDFLTKPIDITALTALLRQWLDQPTHSATPSLRQEPVEGLQTSPTFDENALLKPLGGNRDLAGIIITSATNDFPKYFAQLEQACLASDWQAAERPAHTMKGLAAQIGGLELARQMREADHLLKHGEPITKDTIVCLQHEYAALTKALQHWLKTNSQMNGI